MKSFIEVIKEADETQATASILKLVKIAQKLDNKNYYKLADKFTLKTENISKLLLQSRWPTPLKYGI